MQKVMTTSHEQTSPSGEDELTYSLADFLASLSVTPGDAEARKMTATSGRQCIAPSMKSSPLGLWLKTLLESSRWSSRARFLRWQAQPIFSTRLTTFEDDTNCARPLPCNASAQTLKVTDMPSSRCLFRLVPSEPPTDETGCSSSQGVLLQTPTTVQTDEPPEKMRAMAEKNGYKNGTKFGSLTSQIKYDPKAQEMLYPTPIAWDGAKGGARKLDGHTTDYEHKYSASLKDMAAAQLLPTPRTSEQGNNANVDADSIVNHEHLNLETVIGRVRRANGITAEKDGPTSRLSPLFTEEMMGFPLMWTALPFLSESGAPKPSKPTATPSSPK